MKIKGKIKEIKETQQVTDSFKKREFVLVTEDHYPQTYLVEFTQDKITLIDDYKVGDDVEVSINLRGREYEKGDRIYYFTTIQAWEITKNESLQEAYSEGANKEDDLPF